MVKRGCEVSGYSLSGLKMRWAAIWTVTQVSWQLWITPVRAMDGFSGKDTGADTPKANEAICGSSVSDCWSARPDMCHSCIGPIPGMARIKDYWKLAWRD